MSCAEKSVLCRLEAATMTHCFYWNLIPRKGTPHTAAGPQKTSPLLADATKFNKPQFNYYNCLFLSSLALIVHRSRFVNDCQHNVHCAELDPKTPSLLVGLLSNISPSWRVPFFSEMRLQKVEAKGDAHFLVYYRFTGGTLLCLKRS